MWQNVSEVSPAMEGPPGMQRSMERSQTSLASPPWDAYRTVPAPRSPAPPPIPPAFQNPPPPRQQPKHEAPRPISPPVQPNLTLIEERASHARVAAAALVDGDVKACIAAAAAAAAAGLPLPDVVISDALVLAASKGGSTLATALRATCPSETNLCDAAGVDAASRAHALQNTSKSKNAEKQQPVRELSSRPVLRLGIAVHARSLRRLVHEWPRDLWSEERALCNLALCKGSEPLPLLRFNPAGPGSDEEDRGAEDDDYAGASTLVPGEAPPCWRDLEASPEVALSNRVFSADGRNSTARYYGHMLALVRALVSRELASSFLQPLIWIARYDTGAR